MLTSSTIVLSFINGGIFSEQKRLTCINLSGTYSHRIGTRPPSCVTPREPILYSAKIETFDKVPRS